MMILLDTMENFLQSLIIMGEGMGGIMFVIIIITLIVLLISKLDSKSDNNKMEEE